MRFPRSIHRSKGNAPWCPTTTARIATPMELPRLYAANLASMIGAAGLVLAVAKLQ